MEAIVIRRLGAVVACSVVVCASVAVRSAKSQTGNTVVAEARLIARIRPTSIRGIVHGTISPDGRSIVFENAERGDGRLCVLDIASGSVRLLTPRSGSRSDPVWSYDGKRIALWGGVVLPGHTEPISGTWVVDAATGNELLVHSPGRFGFTPTPTWTRDGRLLFAEFNAAEAMGSSGGPLDPNNWFNLRVADPRTGASTRLTRTLQDIEYPSVSPDGRHVAYFGRVCPDTASGLSLAALTDSALGAPRCLFASPSRSSPVWSPDGRRLYLLEASPADRYSHLLMVDVETGHRDTVSLRGADADLRGVSISDDGRLVVTARSGFTRVGLVPASGGQPVVLQSDTVLTTALPVWSSDGGTIAAIASAPRTGSNLDRSATVTIDVGPSGQRRGAIERSGRVLYPAFGYVDSIARFAWSPDGRCLVDEAGYGSRESSVEMPAPPPWMWARFTEAPGSYATAAMAGGAPFFTRGAQWNRAGTQVIKQSRGQLYVIDRDTTPQGACRPSNPRHIELRGFVGTPIGARLSPDGRRIAFGREARRDTAAGLFVVSVEGGPVTMLRALPHDETRGGPEWTADGSGVYFADTDADGTSRILRLTLVTGTIDTITRGPLSAMHPRLSPDGRTLAVTVTNTATTLWQVRPPGTPSPRITADGANDTRRAAGRPDSTLLDLASRLAEKAPDLARMWPGYWPAGQNYLLTTTVGSPGTLFVSLEPTAVGFREVQLAHPPATPLHAYWRPGTFPSIGGLQVPFVIIDTIPPQTADSIARLRWRERTLHALFVGDDPGGLLERNHRWEMYRERPSIPRFGACSSGLLSSCVATGRVESRALEAALAAPPARLTAAVIDYVALRWMRRHTGRDSVWAAELGYGARSYATRHAIAIVAGADTTQLARDVIDAFHRLPPPERDTFDLEFRREALGGEVLTVLLDRLGRPWKDEIMRGDDFVDALQRSVHFDSTQVIRIAKRAYQAFDLAGEMLRARRPSDTTERTWRELAFNNYDQRNYYTLLAKGLSGDSIPLVIGLGSSQSKRLDSTRFKVRVVAGAGDSVSTADGLVFLPNPESVIVETDGLRAEVHHVPVIIDPAWGNGGPSNRVTIFLPDSVEQRIRERRAAPTGRGAAAAANPIHIVAPGIDLLFGTGTDIARPNTSPPLLYISPPVKP